MGRPGHTVANELEYHDLSFMTRPRLHIITGEYPPQLGGVSDYTQSVAVGLAGDGAEVHVWCPRFSGSPALSPGVTVHRELGRFGLSDWRRVGHQLNRFPQPCRILVQWVAQSYGY